MTQTFIENLPATGVRVDPYWLWARADGYGSLGGVPPRIPVLLELAVTLEAAARSAASGSLPAGLRLSARYLTPLEGMADAHHCTAHATPAFLDALLRGEHATLVRRFEIGLPIVAASEGAATGSGIAEPSGDRPFGRPGEVDRHGDAPRPIGTGVFPPVLAVIDDGLPFAHPLLLGSVAQPNCLAIWDQDVRPPASGRASAAIGTPPGFSYGRLLGTAMIRTALGAHSANGHAPVDAAGVYASLGLTRLRRSWTHGSAVLGLAALGAGYPAGPVAPFIGVHLPRRTGDDTSGLSLGVHVLDALHFVLGQAESSANDTKRAPGAVVVNLSFGRFAGAHDGSGLLSCAIDELIALRNAAGLSLAVVLPAGNGQLSRGHARGGLQPGASQTLTWRIQPDDRTPSFVELWPSTDAGDIAAGPGVTLHSPTGQACGPVAADQQAVMRDCAGRPLATVIHLSRSAAGTGPMILVAVAPTFAFDAAIPTAPSGRWSITLGNRSAQALRIAAWIQRDDRFAGASLGGRQSYFEDAAYQRFDPRGRPLDTDPPESTAWASRATTLNPIATGRYPVVVGAGTAMPTAPGAGPAMPVRASPYSAASTARPPQVIAVADLGAARPGIPTLGTYGSTGVRANGTSLAAPQLAHWLLARAPAPTAAGAPGAPAADWARTAIAAALAVHSPPQPGMPAPIAAARGGSAVLPWP